MEAIQRKHRRIPVTRPVSPIPKVLIYEVWNGKPIYYKGYRDVLAGRKTPQEVMACSDLQGAIVAVLMGFLFNAINRKKYLLATNEIGLHLALNDNLGNDIAIFDKAQVGKLKGRFFEVPPKVVIEVDIKADLSNFLNEETDYILAKSQKMLDFGVDKVVWILTSNRKIIVSTRNQKQAIITDWDDDILLLDGCVLNVKQLLDDEEIAYE
jgi:Uma2 family endonuclease